MTQAELTTSVIVATYQRTDCLPDCLSALDRQETPPTEIIVVARDTDTRTQELLKPWIEANPTQHRMVIVSKPGQLAAMEAGYHASIGAIVAFTDDDARPKPDWLKRMLAYYANPTISGVGGRDLLWRNGKFIDGKTKRVGYVDWMGRITGDSHLEYPHPMPVVTFKGVNMSFRRQFIRFDHNLLGTPTIWPSDTSITLNAVRMGAQLISDPNIQVEHYEYNRKAGDERLTRRPENIFKKSHNITYLLLKFLPWYRWPLFIAYTLLIGQQNTPGLLYDITHHRKTDFAVLRASLRGKWEGFRTYQRWRAAQQHTSKATSPAIQ
jgi:glycosyltransferase involved in cell wall biosynthesis